MAQPLVGKQILTVEDESVSHSLVDSWLSSLGATTAITGNRLETLGLPGHFKSDLMICDLAVLRMNGLELIEYLHSRSGQTPMLMVSTTESISDIAKVLRLGVDDVLLKLVRDLNRLRETVSACLYPNVSNSRVEEEERLLHDWGVMAGDPAAAAKLLKELQSPVSQVISHYRVNYRQLVAADQPGSVLNIASLSNHDLAFYYLDVTQARDNSALATLLLRALFNGLLQKQLTQ